MVRIVLIRPKAVSLLTAALVATMVACSGGAGCGRQQPAPGQASGTGPDVKHACRVSTRGRHQIRAVVPRGWSEEKLKEVAVQLARQNPCAPYAYLVSFFDDPRCLEGWDGTGAVREAEAPHYLGRVVVDVADDDQTLYARLFTPPPKWRVSREPQRPLGAADDTPAVWSDLRAGLPSGKVKQMLGPPAAKAASGKGADRIEIWSYGGGRKLRFRAGRLESWDE